MRQTYTPAADDFETVLIEELKTLKKGNEATAAALLAFAGATSASRCFPP
jgi:hypothetical protein